MGGQLKGTLYHVAIPTDVSLLSLSRRQSRAAGLQRMTKGTHTSEDVRVTLNANNMLCLRELIGALPYRHFLRTV